MSIILVRLGPSGWSYGTSLACARHCRLDPSSTQHGAYVDEDGVFHYQHIDAASGTSTTLLRFQLQYRAAEGLPYEPISKPWTFEFIQGSPGDLLLVQEGSCRILYASLPKQGSDSSDVFLFGSHTAPVCYLSTNGNIVLSGCQGGVLKLWRLSDGQLADTCSLPDKASITAISTLGPLLVAVGSSSSTVTLYDIASGRLLAVQRLMAGPGAVQCMAAWVPHQVLAAANLAPGGPLPPDGGEVLTRQAAEGVAGTGPKALLAVASSSGWLCVFNADQRSSQHQPWSLIHSTGSIIAPGAQPQLAFSPDGTSLAVASPVAQLLGTDAVALAALGAQPGTVSLYEVSSSSVGLSALLPPLLQQQQGQREQLPELLLWHQWSLSSMPVGLFVLPSSGVGLVHGKQLQPAQVLQLYIVPQIGPAQVLKAQHKPPPAPMYSPKHAQQPRVTLLDSYPAPAAAAEAATVAETAGSTAAAEPAPAAAVGSRPQQTAVPLPGSRPAGIATSSSSSSSTSQQGDADDALLLNIAERDLAEVAQAIAAAAGSNLDAELASLLAGATAGMRDLEADDLSAGAAPGADAAAALGNVSVATTQQQQQEGEEAEQGFNGAAETSPADVDTAMAAGVDAAAAAGGAFRLPQTLPGARSWRARLAAVGGSEGAADLSALAQALQEEQEQLRQQQQQQQQQQIPEEVEAAAVAAVVSDAAPAVEQELPSESSFQHLLPTEQGTAAAQHQHALVQQQQVPLQQQEQHLEEQAAGNVQQQPTAPDRHKGAAAGSEGPQEAGLGLQRQRGTAAAEAGAQAPDQAPAAAAAAAVAVTVADVAGARVLPSAAAQEPQPRKLPAMLRISQRAPAATVSAPTAELVDAKQQPGAWPSRSIRAGVGRAAAGRQPGLTWSREQSAADAPAPDSGAQQQQQQQQWQAQQQQQQQLDWEQLQAQQRAKRDVCAQQQQQQQQQPKRLSVQERLNLRRQEVLARQQQGPKVPAAAAAAAVKGATGGVQVVRGDRRLRGAVLAPASDHPLAAAVQNSSRLLAARIQEAEHVPDVVVDPQGPAALKLAAARLADLDLSPEEQQYCYEELPDLKDVPTSTHAPRLVPKQLDAHWVASRSLKPSMDTLFEPQDWQQSFVDPQVLLLPSWPSPQDVVQQLLWPGQRPGVWT